MPDTNDNISTNTISTISIEPANQDGTSTLVTVTHENGHQCQGLIAGASPGDLPRSDEGLRLVAEIIVEDCHSH